MQLLFEGSDENGGCEGLGIIPGQVNKFDPSIALPVPQIGWNHLIPKCVGWVSCCVATSSAGVLVNCFSSNSICHLGASCHRRTHLNDGKKTIGRPILHPLFFRRHESPFLNCIGDRRVYFVHSFCARPTEANTDWVLATAGALGV